MNTNPILHVAKNGEPILELKAGLVLYVKDPPSPSQARQVYDLYLGHFGEQVRRYCSTSPGSLPQQWSSKARQRFESHDLPNLRKQQHWGYGFDDGNQIGTSLFMFHGYRPHQDFGKASFYRFSFPWDIDPGALRKLAEQLVSIVPCLSGFGGYYFQGSASNLNESYNLMFALAHRYWGIEAHNLDRTVYHMLYGYKCVNWLTIIGSEFLQTHTKSINSGKASAFATLETPNAIIFQAQETPSFGDVNRQEVLEGYIRVAEALVPIQITEHQSLGGTKWTPENTYSYIRRFTNPIR